MIMTAFRQQHCLSGFLSLLFIMTGPSASLAESFVIAASPSVAVPLQALGRAFEAANPEVTVRLVFDTGLALRQTIATIENRGPYFIGTGPIHLIAPGGDELIARLQQKYYVLPGTSVSYAAVPLVLVVPESLVDAPTSFESLVQDTHLRVAIADPGLTTLGKQTLQLMQSFTLDQALQDRLDVAADAPSVLDHLLHGKADVAIVYGPDAVQERERVRVVATSFDHIQQPLVHSMAVLRSCPDRRRCEQFLSFLQRPEAHRILAELGYRPMSQKP